MNTSLLRSLSACFALWLCSSGATAVSGLGAAEASEVVNLLSNPGFDSGWRRDASSADSTNENAKIHGEVASAWLDNSSWADVQVTYSQETTNPHGGTIAQRIRIDRVASGAVQFIQPIPFAKNHVYAFSVWIRGRHGQAVELALRRQGAPYTQYAARVAMLSPEWQEFIVEGMIPEAVDGIVMLRAESPCDIVVDDARCLDVTNVSVDVTKLEGNMLAGGSFEGLMPFGWSTRSMGDMRWEHVDNRGTIDDQVAKVGKKSYRVDLSGGRSVELHAPIVHPNIGRPIAVSAWIKASRPDTWVRMELEKTGLVTDVSVGESWQRVTLTGTMPFQRWTRLNMYARAPQSVPSSEEQALSVWVDGVQIEEAATPSDEYRDHAANAFTLCLARPGSIVFDGEDAKIDLSFDAPPPQGSRLRLDYRDVFGGEHALPAVAMPATTIPLPSLANRPRGVFKLRAVLESAQGKALSAAVDLVWARLPRPRAIEANRSYFGIHIPLRKEYCEIAAAIGSRWVRLHDTSMITKWGVTERAPGEWVFYDESVDAAHKAGLAVLGMFDGAPSWVASKPREGGYWGIWNVPDLPGSDEQWATYVRTMTEHYRGRIDTWEMWNEPWGDWWTGVGGTPQRYAELMRIAYRTAKAANPQATILGIDTYSGHDAWHDQVLAAAGTSDFDGFSFHDYSDALYGGPESAALLEAKKFNAAQAAHGAVKPLWNTEGGVLAMGSFYAPETGGMDLRHQLSQAVRYDVTMMAAGVQVFCAYALHNDPGMGTTMNGTEFDRAIKPYLAARAVLASLVDGAGMPQRSEPAPGVDWYGYPARDGSAVQVVWSYDGEPHELPIASGEEVLDVLGNPISVSGATFTVGIEPVYVIRPAL